MDNSTIQRLIKNARPPNTAGKSVASKANGPMMTKVGITAHVGVEDGGWRIEDGNPKSENRNSKLRHQTASAHLGFQISEFELGVSAFGFSISGPNPGGTLGSGSGGAFLPETPSIIACRKSAVVPLKVLRK